VTFLTIFLEKNISTWMTLFNCWKKILNTVFEYSLLR
jgi:hypothetical protein